VRPALRPARRKYLRARASLHLNMISAISIAIRGTLRAFHRSVALTLRCHASGEIIPPPTALSRRLFRAEPRDPA